MRDSHVVVLGLRGLGAEVCKNLALAGIGALTLVDDGAVCPECVHSTPRAPCRSNPRCVLTDLAPALRSGTLRAISSSPRPTWVDHALRKLCRGWAHSTRTCASMCSAAPRICYETRRCAA